jgi:hypothetical protein
MNAIDNNQIRKVDRALGERAFDKRYCDESSQERTKVSRSRIHWRRQCITIKRPPNNKSASVDGSGIGCIEN